MTYHHGRPYGISTTSVRARPIAGNEKSSSHVTHSICQLAIRWQLPWRIRRSLSADVCLQYIRRKILANCGGIQFASAHDMESLVEYFNPLQIGVGVSGNCETPVHAISWFLATMISNSIIIKLDFSNAFNSLGLHVVACQWKYNRTV